MSPLPPAPQPPAPATEPRWLTVAICLALAAMVWAVFGQTRHFQFINFDDPDYVYANPLTNQGVTWHNVVWAFTHENRHEWLPVAYISRMVDSQIYGSYAGGHHVTNVLLHAATAILLFLLLRKMTGALWCAAFAAAVFAIHPLRAQSVAWVVERKDVLSGVFFMLALWAWTLYVGRRRACESAKPIQEAPALPRHRLGSYCLALVFFALGSLSKPTVVTLPLILLLLDYWPLNHVPAAGPGGAPGAWRRWLPLFWEKIPFFLVSAAGCAAAMMTQKNIMLAGQHKGLYWRFGNVLFAYADYLWHTVYPAGLALVYPYSNANPQITTVAWSGLVLLIISMGALLARRRHPYVLVGWLWYLGMLLPVIDTTQATQNCRADRYTYLPQIGICLLVAWGAAELLKRWRHRALALGMAAAIVLPALLADAYVQTRYWQDSTTIWTRALACTSSNSFAENSLGSALSNQDRWNEAVPHFERAIRFKPDFIDARVNLGITLDNLGKLDDAIQQFKEALQWNPNAADACYNLGSTLAEEGKTAEAIPYLSRALELKPDLAKAHYDLGLALASQEKWADAIPHYEQALGVKLDQTSAQYVTGVALAGHKQWDKAIALYEQALQARPDFAEAHYRLGMALAGRGEPAAAAEHFQKALALATTQGNTALAASVRAQLGTNAPALPPPH